MVIRVGILRGGPSAESVVSLKTGESVLKNLPKDKYFSHDIILSRNGEWYFDSKPSHPEKIFRSVDVVFNALHGYYGEDGKVQKLLEIFGIPYTGSGILSSALAMSKHLSRDIFAKIGIKVPASFLIRKDEKIELLARDVFKSIGPELVVKPADSGSSFGISITKNFNDFVSAIENVFEHSSIALIEEYIKGREATCGIVDNFRGEEHYVLPVVEIVPPEKSVFFDYDAKYSGRSREVCPSNFSLKTKRELENLARLAHKELGCRHYSRTDFIVSPRGIYLLEVNTLPGLTAESLLPKSIEAIGVSYPDFLDHLITLALSGK